MNDNLRYRIACVLAGITPNNTPKLEYVELADAVISAIDRDYIVVEPGTPLAQKIVEWQWENNG